MQLDTPEGLIAGLGYALTCPGHMFQFHQATTAEERSGLAGVHQWSIMLPTSARVAQEVYVPMSVLPPVSALYTGCMRVLVQKYELRHLLLPPVQHTNRLSNGSLQMRKTRIIS